MNDYNNREMICHEKSILQLSAKLDVTFDPLYELIRNGALGEADSCYLAVKAELEGIL